MGGFETETHSKDFALNYEPHKEINEADVHNSLVYDLKALMRLLRKNLLHIIKPKKKNEFKCVLYVTLNEPPIDYILAFRNQYPDKVIKVITAVDDIKGLENTGMSFEYYLQNRMNTAKLYKFPKNRNNIEIYGLYSSAFSGCDRIRLQYLAPFVKALRICAKELKPDIIHSDNVPFFLGAEFESKISYPAGVFQLIRDFGEIEANKTEAFWTAINLADKRGMKKICRDKIIKKCIASLFNLHNTKRFYQMRECLEFIYANYFKFRKYIDKCEDIDENILFNRMNARAVQLFPQLSYEGEMFCNSMYNSLKKVDFWAVISKTYYNEILNSPELSGKNHNRIIKTKNKSSYVSYGCNIEPETLYQPFSTENFRELRKKNKKYLLKELSRERIKTRFLDINLFEDKNYAIYGYLDSFYEAPLIFIRGNDNILADGIDIAFNTIFKLFELHKNIQVIINFPDGLKNDYIKTRVNFLEKNYSLNGRWVFIDGRINLARFYAAADMAFYPVRSNTTSTEHYTCMKYGCIPIASRVGIYNDTIADIFDDITYGCGFKTKTKLTIEEDANMIYFETVSKALNLYVNNPASWNLLIKNSMNYDSGWRFDIIERYNTIYEQILR